MLSTTQMTLHHTVSTHTLPGLGGRGAGVWLQRAAGAQTLLKNIVAVWTVPEDLKERKRKHCPAETDP